MHLRLFIFSYRCRISSTTGKDVKLFGLTLLKTMHRYLLWSCLGLATMMRACFDAKSCKSMIDVTHARRRVDAIIIESRIHSREDKRNNSGGVKNENAKTYEEREPCGAWHMRAIHRWPCVTVDAQWTLNGHSMDTTMGTTMDTMNYHIKRARALKNNK